MLSQRQGAILRFGAEHRLDEASATLVFQLVSAGKAAAVVTVRSGKPMPEGVRSLWKDGLLERLDLQPLGRDDTIALAGDFLGGQPDGEIASVGVPAGLTLMDASVRNNLPGILAECGGMCSCGTCHVYVDAQWASLLPEPEFEEAELLEFLEGTESNSRLSCQIVVTDELEILVTGQMPDVIRGTCNQVVYGDNSESLGDEAIAQVRSKKSRPTCHDRDFLGRSSLEHLHPFK